jgi:hypothetical protein
MQETHLDSIDDVRVRALYCALFGVANFSHEKGNVSFKSNLQMIGIKDWWALPQTLKAPVLP